MRRQGFDCGGHGWSLDDWSVSCARSLSGDEGRFNRETTACGYGRLGHAYIRVVCTGACPTGGLFHARYDVTRLALTFVELGSNFAMETDRDASRSIQ